MTSYFKIAIATLFIFICIHQTSFGQDTSKAFNESWQTLKTQLLRRTNLAKQFAQILSQNKNVDTSFITQLNKNAADISATLNINDTLSNIIVNNIHDKNDSLSMLLKKGFDILQSDKTFTPTNEFQDVLMQLEGTENRIYIAIKDFDEACKNIKRQDLYFAKPWGDTEMNEDKNN